MSAFLDLFTLQLLYAALIVLVAGVVRGFSGFGSALVMVPVMAGLYSPVTAVSVGLLLELVLAAPLMPNAMRQVDRRRIALLGLAAAFGIPLGIWLLNHLAVGTLRIAMSAAVMAAVAMLASGWRYHGKPNALGTGLAGLASGTMNGAVGMGGPPVIFYYLSGADTPATVRASLIVYLTLLDLVSVALLVAAGAIGWLELRLSLLLAPPLLLGLWLGTLMFHKGGVRFYRPTALVILAAVAVGSLLF